MRTLWSRIKATLLRRRLERDLADQIEAHLDLLTEENVAKGMTREEARLAARRSFGGMEQMKEEYRDRRGFPALESLAKDVRYGVRIMRRNPGFTAVAVLTLAIGISANTTVFAVVHNVLIRPLRVPHPERVVAVMSATLDHEKNFSSAPGVFLDWRERSTSFELLAGASPTSMIQSGAEQPRRVEVVKASRDFFDLIGAAPIRGRTFTAEEDRPGGTPVALVREGTLGGTITLDDTAHTVIGILPAGIRFARYGEAEVWVPLAADRRHRGGGAVVVAGRLKSGVSLAAAQSEMEAVMRGIRRERQEDSGTDVLIRPLDDWVAGGVRRTFLILLGAVALVLLIGCANLASMLLARATARAKEMAVRASLGASRGRLARQTLVENAVLAGTGGALGVLLALLAIPAVRSLRAFYIPRADEIALNSAVLLFAAGVSMASGLLFGLAPALQAGRGAAARTGSRLRNALVVSQIALTLVLLAGAGLLMNSLVRLLRLDLGFQRTHVVTVGTRLPKRYGRQPRAALHRALIEEVRRLPGVEEASASDFLPLQAVLFPYQIEGPAGRCEAMARHVAPKYLRVLGIPLAAGRDLEPADESRTPVLALVNGTLARLLFGGANPLGKQVTTNYKDRKVLEIVGVVGGVRQLGLKVEPGLQLYLPLGYGHAHNLIVRARTRDLAPAVRNILRKLDPGAPAPAIGSMDAEFSQAVATPRFHATLLGCFAATALLLAALGVYGVTAYAVERRTHEFGIRMALGARRGDILRLALGTSTRLIAAGCLIGVAGALAATRVLSALLYGVRPHDPLTLAAVLALLAVVAALASFIAARRAAAVDPNVALRYE